MRYLERGSVSRGSVLECRIRMWYISCLNLFKKNTAGFSVSGYRILIQEDSPLNAGSVKGTFFSCLNLFSRVP